MEEILDVLGVVKGSGVAGGLGGLFDIPWLARIYAFENTQSAEIWESDLQFSHRLRSGDVVLCLAGTSFLLDFRHCDFGARNILPPDVVRVDRALAPKKFRGRNIFAEEVGEGAPRQSVPGVELYLFYLCPQMPLF